MIGSSTMRRLALSQTRATTLGSRSSYHMFVYPHSHTGTNNAFDNAPVKHQE